MRSALASAARFSLPLLFAIAAQASAGVYVVAHPDDDILMMGPSLIKDIKRNHPTVIIVVTAGDAGNGALPSARDPSWSDSFNIGTTPYYRARLNARQNALESWIPLPYARPWERTTVSWGSQTPQVEKVTLGNVTEYHLNLPDQVESNRFTTIENLLNTSGMVAEYSTYDVTGQNHYNAEDLKDVIRQIIKLHFPETPNLVIHYQEPRWLSGAHQPVERKISTDHVDHTAVGKVVKQAIEDAPAFHCMRQRIYYGYSEADAKATASTADQRLAYETLHQTLLVEGNVTPIIGLPIKAGGTWTVTKEYGAKSRRLQMGTMDTFHKRFYGKQVHYGIPPSGSCNLGTNG